MLTRLRRYLRPLYAPDATLLGEPGYRYWHAHLRHLALYGLADWRRWRAFARARRAEWIADGRVLRVERNWRGSVFVEAVKP